MSTVSSNKTIAKNTLMLYIRMFITMIVSLYTSRVILQVLGVEDYGIYHSVGGITMLMTFVNHALATGTSRYITYSLGKNDERELNIVFSTALTIHIALAIFIVFVAETVGLWFLYNKLIIPPERMSAALYCYQMSIVTIVLGITQVPYNALIIGHERMNMYAYTSIVEVILKLVIVYVLYISPVDKLKVYATLFMLLSAGMRIFYRVYCIKQFKEAHYHFELDKKYVKEIGSFSGWSLFTNGVLALNNQGILILLNLYFSPAVVAARAISLQVNNAVMQFVTSFRTAVNPQITKRLAMGDMQSSKTLVIESAKVSYYLVLIFTIPIILTTGTLLRLWLGQVPEYSVRFVQLILIETLFSVRNTSLYQALYAHGNIRENAILSTLIAFSFFILSFLCLYLGSSPLWVSYMAIARAFMLGLVEKPYMLIKIAHYEWSDFIKLSVPCLAVTICALPFPLLYYYYVYQNAPSSVVTFVLMAVIAITSTALSIWYVGLTKEMKHQLVEIVKTKINSKRNMHENIPSEVSENKR